MLASARLSVKASAQLTNAVDLGSARADISESVSVALAAGVAAGQADVVWQDTITLAPSATQDIDLVGALKDALGGDAIFARVKGIIVAADAGNTNNVIVGAGTAPWVGLLGATHTVTLRKGAVFAAFAGAADAIGYAVVATTGDILKVANSGGATPVTLNIVIIGASA